MILGNRLSTHSYLITMYLIILESFNFPFSKKFGSNFMYKTS